MQETEKITVFVKAINALNRKVVLDVSIPKGFLEVHINPEDESALNNFKKLTKRMLKQELFMMESLVHTSVLGKEATDRLISQATGGSCIRRWFYLKKMNRAFPQMMSDVYTHVSSKNTQEHAVISNGEGSSGLWFPRFSGLWFPRFSIRGLRS